MTAFAIIPNPSGFREIVEVSVEERFDEMRAAFVRQVRNPNLSQFVSYDFLASDPKRLSALVSRQQLSPAETAAFAKKRPGLGSVTVAA